MTKLISRIGDRMLSALVPSVKASAMAVVMCGCCDIKVGRYCNTDTGRFDCRSCFGNCCV